MFRQGQIEDLIVEVLKEQTIFSDSLDTDMRRAAPIALSRWMQEVQVAQLPAGISASVSLALWSMKSSLVRKSLSGSLVW
jgi:hypothetical protein